MMNHRIFIFLLLLLPFLLEGQDISVDRNKECIALQNIAQVYKDVNNRLSINHLLSPNQVQFKPLPHLNIGITYKNHWLRFALKNTEEKDVNLFLVFSSIVNDSIILYKTANGKVVEETTLGEVLPFSAKAIKYPTPVFLIHLKANEPAQYFVKSIGNGQPMNLTADLLNTEGYHRWDTRKMFFIGLIYGILILLLLLNFSFYVITKERIYLILVGQLLASMLGLLYFDGYIYQYIFPNSGYWSNETIAIALCATFIFSNIFISNFFNLKALAPLAHRIFQYITYTTLGTFAVSFIHPQGFNFFIAFIVGITSIVAGLLFVSVLVMRRLGISSYFFILLATISLIIFGSTFQLFIAGFLPDNFFTHYGMHLAVVLQSVFLAFGVNDKFRIIQEENTYYQAKFMETMEKYSQNLIANIEAERHRLAIEIHDGLGQNLLAIRNTILRGLKQKKMPMKIEETFHTLLDITTDILEDTRAMSYNLRPPILNTMGLTVAIESLVEKMRESSSIEINLKRAESIDSIVDKDLEINIYRILQESFSNTLKHANASTIDLTIVRKAAMLEIAFQDNGIGYNQSNRLNGQGILGIKERVALLKGTLTITSDAETGTLLFISIPTTSP